MQIINVIDTSNPLEIKINLWYNNNMSIHDEIYYQQRKPCYSFY